MLQAIYRLCGPLVDSSWEIPVFLELGSPELDTVVQTWPHQGRVGGEDQIPRRAGHALFNAPQDPTGANCWLMANLLSTRTSRFFSTELLSSRSSHFSVYNLIQSINNGFSFGP